MTTAPNLVVTGDVGLSQKLRDTGRFPAVFDVASATELRDLSKSGEVRPPAAFLFTPGFAEDMPEARVPDLANGLAADGFTVVVHGFFTERGDRFGEGVVASTRPMSLSDLLAALGVARPASPAAPGLDGSEPDLHPEPPPEPWEAPENWEVPPEQALTDALGVSAHPAPAPPADVEQPVESTWEEAPPEPEPEDWTQPAPEPAPTPEPVSDQVVWPQAAPVPEPEPEHWTQPPPDPEAEHWTQPPPEPEPAAWTQPAPEPDHAVWPQIAPAPAAARAAPRSRDRGRGRRAALLSLVALVVIAVGIGAAGLVGGDWSDEGRPQAHSAPEPSAAQPSKSAKPSQPRSSQAEAPPAPKSPKVPSSTPTAVRPVKQYAPGAVRIVDSRVSIEVIWTDSSGGRASHYVVGGPVGRPPSTLGSAPPGTAKVVVTALNPGVDYCLTVVAVVDVDRVAQAKPVCTHRVKRSG